MPTKKTLNTSSLISDAVAAVAPDPAPTKATATRPEKRKRDETEQLNIRVTAGTGKDLKMWAMAHDVNPADVIEQGFELMKQKFGT